MIKMFFLENSNSLIEASGNGSNFAQQGSLDWVALGRTQYSASIAVLGRLAKAGIDSLTVAFGQALCLRLPIGSHGEKVLAESMSKLTAKSIGADLIWFGIGVRHILREMVQTSQGCSLVALCAALTESHSTAVSALVLYEIAKQCGGPPELAPSLEQWEALIRVTASVFNQTTFGLRISQIAKFSESQSRTIPNLAPNPHPTDLAKLLLEIGRITEGSLQSISIQGGCCCSWIAAWADFLLGLRVLVRDSQGTVVYANFNVQETYAQVNIAFLHQDEGRMLVVQTSHVLRSGTEFIQKSFGRQRLSTIWGADYKFSCGRVQWDTMFSDTFGPSFQILFGRTNSSPSSSFGPLESHAPDLFLEYPQIVERIFALAAILLVNSNESSVCATSASRYCMRAMGSIPELRQWGTPTLSAIQVFCTIYGGEKLMLDCFHDVTTGETSTSLKNIAYEFIQYMHKLGALCGCAVHKKHLDGTSNGQMCLTRLALTILRAMVLLDHVVLDTPIQPTFHGLYSLFHSTAGKEHWPDTPSPEAITRDLDYTVIQTCSQAFSTTAAMFSSAEDWAFDIFGVVAQSDGKIYCYTQLLEGLTDDPQEAFKIHVGSGQIEYLSRPYRAVYDTSGQQEAFLGSSARKVEVVESIDSLASDTTSPRIESQLVVDEEPTHLCVRHRISTDSGHTFISPSAFYEQLQNATCYKRLSRIPEHEHASWSAVLSGGFKYILVHGEGLVVRSRRCHMLRPHRGNLLGRCVALSRTKDHVALVKTDEDLKIFARYWARLRDEDLQSSKPLTYFVLIS
ncbi:unnamed protein product [Periconia digitata]|uniref:Uncharacterized protein n=1 Tax=Periconia digitata TaxID=1303443 RepID=A0A9W4URV0_9PLEO|nr:unnamed protein product [Periconia digitata]